MILLLQQVHAPHGGELVSWPPPAGSLGVTTTEHGAVTTLLAMVAAAHPFADDAQAMVLSQIAASIREEWGDLERRRRE